MQCVWLACAVTGLSPVAPSTQQPTGHIRRFRTAEAATAVASSVPSVPQSPDGSPIVKRGNKPKNRKNIFGGANVASFAGSVQMQQVCVISPTTHTQNIKSSLHWHHCSHTIALRDYYHTQSPTRETGMASLPIVAEHPCLSPSTMTKGAMLCSG